MRSNQYLNVGLIGVGGFGECHARCIRKLEAQGRVRLAAAADPAFGAIPALPGVACFQDYREMLRAGPDLDVVTIAAPIPYHFDIALECIRRGVFVYLEKPPVPLIQQLDALIEADCGRRVGVAFQWIASESIRWLKGLATRGELGKIRDIRACGAWPRTDSYYGRAGWAGRMNYRGQPVFDGPLTNALAHLVHNVMFLAAPSEEAFDAPAEVSGELFRARPMESYDIGCVRGRFASGVRFSAAVAHAVEKDLPFAIEVRGSRGWARVARDGALLETSGGETRVCEETSLDAMEKAYCEFLDFAQGGRCRAGTMLEDARGYVLATNGAWVSSGGIAEVSPERVRVFHERGERGVDVGDLIPLLQKSFETGCLLSEMGFSARIPAPCAVAGLKSAPWPAEAAVL